MPLEVADGQELSDLLTGRDAILTVDGALTLANSAEVTAMFMGVEADTLILNAADKSYAQSGGFLALANAGNAWMFRGGRLDLENMTVFMENGGGANTRFGAANGQIVGGGMTGRFVNVVFTARAAVNFNFGAESLASAIEELGNTYRAGFVHQRRSGLIFVGVNLKAALPAAATSRNTAIGLSASARRRHGRAAQPFLLNATSAADNRRGRAAF